MLPTERGTSRALALDTGCQSGRRFLRQDVGFPSIGRCASMNRRAVARLPRFAYSDGDKEDGMTHRKKVAILVGGGPAPGINSVIGAATIRAALEDVEVVGIEDGFEWIMQGNVDHVRPLTIDAVSRIHFRGGCHIGISRANPTTRAEYLENTVTSLLRLDVSDLITIGGDDTAFSAMKLEEKSAGRIHVVHVPKSIDNDLDLPPHVDTFGYQTARHLGVEILKNLMVDARTTSRWYYVIAMGRKAGHLALGIGKAAGATITLIPEEFRERPIRLKTIVDTLVASMIKRLASGRRDGVAVIAEGVVLSIDPQDLAHIEETERDDHGNLRIAEVNIGEILKHAVQERLAEFHTKATIVAKNIGYELRCADPIPCDMEYTRDLGYCASKYLLGGGNAVVISMQAGHFVPIPFARLLDPETGRARMRMVDTHSARYAIARRYMIRMRRDDFDDPHELAKFAATAGITLPEFRREFEYLVADEPPPLDLEQSESTAYRLLHEGSVREVAH
jgi:ATP-dependent phosphofructokinase / diphosphate-dependent phosphofructokinase